MQPATARFLARKLAIRFVSDAPPQALVDRLAQSYLSSGGDVSTVLRALFHSPEFWTPTVYRAKVKTPIEFVVSAIRSSNARVDNLQPLANSLRQMGMPLYGQIPPTGYKWEAADWVSTAALAARMNFALALAANRLPGITTTWIAAGPQFPQALLPELNQEEARLEAQLISGGLSISTRSAALSPFLRTALPSPASTTKPAAAPNSGSAYIAARNPKEQEKFDQTLAGLLLGSPEFQRR